MPIKQVFEKREDAPEWLRSALIEDGGKFVFEAETTTEIAGLKKTIDALRLSEGELSKLKKQIEGMDIDEAKKAVEAAKQAENDKLKAKGDWETREANLKQQLSDQFTKEYGPIKAQNEKLTAAVEKHLKESVAAQAIADAKGNTRLLLPHVLQHIKVVEENGEYVARVMKDGQVRIGDAKGTPMTISQLVEAEFKSSADYAGAFAASGAAGSGAGPTNGGAGSGYQLSREQAKDPQTYRAAKEAAAKAGQQLTISET